MVFTSQNYPDVFGVSPIDKALCRRVHTNQMTFTSSAECLSVSYAECVFRHLLKLHSAFWNPGQLKFHSFSTIWVEQNQHDMIIEFQEQTDYLPNGGFIPSIIRNFSRKYNWQDMISKSQTGAEGQAVNTMQNAWSNIVPVNIYIWLNK